MWGVSEAEPGKKPVVVTATMGGKRDPGYWETSRFLLESALCLALQVSNLTVLPMNPLAEYHARRSTPFLNMIG